MDGDPRLEGTRATYDRIAVEYAARSGEDDLSPEFRAWRAAAVAGARGPFVDLGCGPGRDLAVARAAGVPCLGIDVSPGMLALAAARGLPVVRGDLRRPPLRPGSVGTLYSAAALLHVPREDVAATLSAWRGLLQPGGTLRLSTSLGGDEGWEVVPYAPDRGPTGGQRLERWFVHHELRGLTGLLAQAGFTVLEADVRTSHRRWAMVTALASARAA